MNDATSLKHPLFALVTACLLALPSTSAVASGEHEGGHGGSGDQQQEQKQNKEHGEGHAHDAGHGHEGGHGRAFGQPASADAADRTVEIVARDTMRFEPSEVEVDAGETIRFVVRNTGKLQHSFTLGTPAGQKAHERQMQGMSTDAMAGHMKGDPTGMVVPPGETRTLAWRFADDGPVEFACHIPGHYPAGMKGKVRFQ